ncbi:hypothetical protein PIROE2DRAFT_1954 [Piromyces sp. E2]|nr:hypothetical protein PIROE2DRAFT_1954 [Piromyces sp. E2]|eukprot:OUM70009.1 hypothetical protein PIROE2DRAFT_1954 [Piromyces sp. E2]
MITKILVNLLSLALVLAKVVENIEKTVEYDLPIFNLESGFYEESFVNLKLETSDPDAIIYYTIDGSIPNENSIIYENPITLNNKSLEENILSAHKQTEPTQSFAPIEKINKANVIRAIAKYPNKNNTFSEVVSKTYWVGMNRNSLYGDLPLISLMTDPDNLFDYEKGIYVLGKDYDDWLNENPDNIKMSNYLRKANYSRKGKTSEVPAFIEYFPAEKNRQGFSDNVGIRIMGAASRSYVQKSFRVTYREEYGKKNLKYDLFKGNSRSDGKGPITKYKSFNIRNAGNDNRFTIFRDILFQTLIRDRDFDTQSQDLAVLYLDGEFWGVYQLTENYSEHYIADNYDVDKDNVAIIKKYNVEVGVDNDLAIFNQTINFIESENMADPKNYAKVAKQFDINAFAWYGAFISYIENRDSMFNDNNWAFWHVREPVPDISYGDGIWRYMLFDTESAAGNNRDASEYVNPVILRNALNSTSTLGDSIGSKLLVSLIKNRDFKNLFINALCDVRNINFALDRVNSLIDELDERIRIVMAEQFVRYFKREGNKDEPIKRYTDSLENLKTWINGRHSIYMDYLSDVFNYTPAVEVTVTSKKFKKGGFTINGGSMIFNKEYKGLYFKENILYLTATPAQGRTFKYWKIKNCKFANRNYSVNTKQSKFKKATVGIYPSEDCKVVAYFK